MVFSNSSSLLNNTGNLLRKRRKRLMPYKGKWQQTFNEQQAMEALKKAASETKTGEEHQQIPTSNTNKNNSPPFLLSTLINSFAIYGCDPTPSAYSFLIKTLVHNSHFHQLPPVLDHIQNVHKFDPPEEFFSYLIRSYGYVNMIDEAVELFFRIPSFRCTPSALSLNALLCVLCKRKECLRMVHQVLLKSQAMNIRLEESSFRILIHALCKIKKIGFAIEILDMMFEYGYDPDSTLYSSVLSSMCKIREIYSVEIMGFLEEMRQKGFSPNGLDYANVVGFLVKARKEKDAFGLLNQMKMDGIKPDVVVYTSVLDGIIKAGDFQKAEELFDEMLVLGVVPNVHTYNIYINGLCMQNKYDAASKIIVCMEELGCKPDVATYNTLMRALCKSGKAKIAREEVLRKMRLKGLQENSRTYSILIDGLMCEGELVEACKLFENVLNRGFIPTSLTCDQMIFGLCKRGLISEALRVIEQMVERDITPGLGAWQSLVSISEPCLEVTTLLDLVLGLK